MINLKNGIQNLTNKKFFFYLEIVIFYNNKSFDKLRLKSDHYKSKVDSLRAK